MLRTRLTVALGVIALAGAAAVVLTGGGWWSFWPGLLGVSLVIRPARLRYWKRRKHEDPALIPLEAMWWSAALTALAVLFGILLIGGIWFHHSSGRGFLMFVAAIFGFIAWSKARTERKRLLRKAQLGTEGEADDWHARPSSSWFG
jgi:hypothetical protein